MMTVVKWFLWLIIYSFIGWVYESTICSIDEKKLVNRGFLNGPLCPVYGFGSLLVIFCLYERIDNIFMLLLAGIILTCTVEYITSVLLEKLFNTRWWDYSHYRFQLNGRICLLGAVVFGTMSVLLVRFVHPFISGLILQIPDAMQLYISLFALVLIIFDSFITMWHMFNLNGRLMEIQTAINKFLELKTSLIDKFEDSEFYNERIKMLINLGRFQNIRLTKAFPKMRPLKHDDAWQKIKNFAKQNNRK